jgi:hypothetical protein
MGDFQSLTAFKEVIFSPLKRSQERSQGNAAKRPEQLPGLPPLPSNAPLSIASVHDHHNIEVKTVSELTSAPSTVETDIFLFIPRNFEIASIGPSELQRDFRSRMRLALPLVETQGSAALDTALKALRLSLFQIETSEFDYETDFDLNHPHCEGITEAAKDLCAVIAETLKLSSSEHVRMFFLTHTLNATESGCIRGIQDFNDHILAIGEMFGRTRAVVNHPETKRFTVLQLFDEYTSQLYVKYLAHVRHELSKIGPPPAGEASIDYHTARRKLDGLLDEQQEREAQHRRRFVNPSSEEESDLDRERRMVRLSHLKKFFQSRTFVEISREKAAQRVSESTAAIGTATAGIVAAMIEQFSRPEIKDFAAQSLIVVSFGVLVYVLRDRLKDKAKELLFKRASKFLPDFEQQLMAKDKKIGTVKEWFRVLGNKDLPADVLKIRQQVSASEMEKRLPEDIFHCRKIQDVHGTFLAAAAPMPMNRVLHENTRINLERYLKHMDDPFKDMTDLDATGRFTRSRLHRVYHFYLCVKTVAKPAEGFDKVRARFSPSRLIARRQPAPSIGQSMEQTHIYRIVIDKNGVVRLEEPDHLRSI